MIRKSVVIKKGFQKREFCTACPVGSIKVALFKISVLLSCVKFSNNKCWYSAKCNHLANCKATLVTVTRTIDLPIDM